MRRVRNRISEKLRGSAGESLGEVLIALLIAALALTMLASVISSASRMIVNSKTTIAAYYDANNKLDAHETGSGVTVAEKTIKIVDQSNQDVYLFSPETGATWTGYTVNCYSNGNSGSTPVIAYGMK